MLITFTGSAIRVAFWGLDPVGWAISLGLGFTVLIINFLLKYIPAEKLFWGLGSRELKVEDLSRQNSLMLRKAHSKKFYQKQPHIRNAKSKLEDKIA